MGLFVRGTSKIVLPYKYNCIYCGHSNTEIAKFTASATANYSYGKKRHTEKEELVKEASIEYLKETIEKAQKTQIFNNKVIVQGTCTHCKKTKSWAYASHTYYLRIVLSVLFGIASFCIGLKLINLSALNPSETMSLFIFALLILMAYFITFGIWNGSAYLLGWFAKNSKTSKDKFATHFPVFINHSQITGNSEKKEEQNAITKERLQTEKAQTETSLINTEIIRLQDKEPTNCSITKEEAIKTIRKYICEEIAESGKDTVLLEPKLLWDDAKKCISDDHSINICAVSFFLCTQNMKLRIDCGDYPNAYGASSGFRAQLSANEFHAIAMYYDFAEEYKLLMSEDDWRQLKNEEVKEALTMLEEIKKEEAEKQRLKNGVVIPYTFKNKAHMEYNFISIYNRQRFGNQQLSLRLTDGKYSLLYSHSLNPGFTGNDYYSKRELSELEAAWAEQCISDALEEQNDEQFTTHFGDEKMSVTIERNHQKVVNKEGAMFVTYSRLMDTLSKLAVYGSISEAEN